MNQTSKLAFVLSCLISGQSFAETPPTNSGLTAVPEAVVASVQPSENGLSAVSESGMPTGVGPEFKSPKDRLALSYYGVYYGPSLGQRNDYTPSYDGSSGDVQNLDGIITAGYRVSKKFLAGVAVPLVYVPYRDKGVTMNNLFLKLANSEFWKNGRSKMGLSSRFYLPTNGDSRKSGFVTGARIEQNFTYDLKKAPVTLGLYTYEKALFYNATATSGTPLTLYAAPYLNYQFSKRVAATLWVDLVQLTQAKGKSFSEMQNAPVDIEPGINWDVTDNLSLNPYLNLFPGNMTADSSSLGLIVSAKVM